MLAQILSGAGLTAGVTVGALLADHMLGSTEFAGVPSALFTAGAALGAVSIGRWCAARGRRPGLTLGYATGALGSIGVVAAASTGSVALLFPALLVYGVGTATGLMARYAGADLASPARRGRAVSTVLFATTLGAVAGPMLVTPVGEVAATWGVPRLAGPFLLAAAAFGVTAVVVACLLRPDPLLLAQALSARAACAQGGDAVTGDRTPGRVRAAPSGPAGTNGSRTRSPETARGHEVAVGASVMVLTQLVMIAVMTMTPVHMLTHGHTVQAAGLVISLHVGAMFLPSPLTGLLVDRIGRRWVAGASGALLLAAGTLSATAPADSLPALSTALVLLGLGWNFGLISGTAIVTDALHPDRRATTEGLVDVGIAIAGAAGSLVSGLVVGRSGYPVLALAGGVVALAVIPIVTGRARKGGATALGKERSRSPR
ncbi:MFS transporter [Streptomyces cyaneofuscatus]|uniref:MFS transporter n=1 Tax=Streptomyces cyaneofuscatus TaxID=66883 RepID=UPI0033C1CEBE